MLIAKKIPKGETPKTEGENPKDKIYAEWTDEEKTAYKQLREEQKKNYEEQKVLLVQCIETYEKQL